jgi:acyl-CoA thioesterase-1
LAGCGSPESGELFDGTAGLEKEKDQRRVVEASPDESAPLVVFLGDSLTAGYGLSEKEAFPQLLAERLAAAGTAIRLVNAGVSGDTSVGGERRLGWLLEQSPDVLVVELGANDGLRGLPLEMTRGALETIVNEGLDGGAAVLLLGMKVPPNYGPSYSQGFERIFSAIAVDLDVPLVPFLLAGVGGLASLNQVDGIHPTAEGHEILADNVYPYLADLLDEL